LREWDRERSQELHRFEGHADWIAACSYSPDETRILSASNDNTIWEWDRDRGQVMRRFEGHKSRVTSFAYSWDGNRIFSASLDGTLKVWSVRDGSCVFTLYGSTGFRSLAVSRSGVAAGDYIGNVWILDCNLV
jgi:WD40 repeat protein